MSRFKVGDTVEIIYEMTGDYIGQVGTVVATPEDCDDKLYELNGDEIAVDVGFEDDCSVYVREDDVVFASEPKKNLIIYARTIEEEAIKQIEQMERSPLGENAHIRIMPDAHAGSGCVIGTTMLINDKVCPNLVGVDIGCGVLLCKIDVNFKDNFEKLDNSIRATIPFGRDVHTNYPNSFDFSVLRCYKYLGNQTKVTAAKSLGTLGGGNHFIEAYEDGHFAIHSGSRNIGYKVAEYYQKLAEKQMTSSYQKSELLSIPAKDRAQWIIKHKADKPHVHKDLAYLIGQDKEDYLHDMHIIQEFATKNRMEMAKNIAKSFNKSLQVIVDTPHNYIDKTNVLRKGAVQSLKNQLLVIPLNMRDGMLICKGKGNPEWNHSAPHGAGRLYSRTMAKANLKVEDFIEMMKDVYSTTVNANTLDESPLAYKDWTEIIEMIEPTANVIKRIIPIYNFKAE